MFDMGKPYYENSEGLDAFNINPDHWRDRPAGLSAMLRVKNEADFLDASVESIIGWHDEVCIFVQGAQEDDTTDIALGLSARYPSKVHVFFYPFDSVHNGPGHHLQPRGSVYERAYFYNWCLAKTRFAYANKWDGDMVAIDKLGSRVRHFMDKGREGIYFTGLDLVGRDLAWESMKRNTATEQRVHRVTEKVWYFTHQHCEHLSITAIPDLRTRNIERLNDFQFLHLKWCKSSLRYSGVGWPEDWETGDPYYQEIRRVKEPARRYHGAYPAALKPYLEAIRVEASADPKR